MKVILTYALKCARSLTWMLAFLPLLALALSTVASSGAAHAQESGLPKGMLETQWKLIEIRHSGQDVKDATYTGVAGTTLLFELEGRVGGSSPCNTYSAPYQAGAGEQLTIGDVVSTRRACLDPALQALESKYYSALSGVSSYSLDGSRLRLFYDNGQGVLEFVASAGRGMPRTGNSGPQVMLLLLAALSIILVLTGMRLARVQIRS
jgi:heat shock protein HslJ